MKFSVLPRCCDSAQLYVSNWSEVTSSIKKVWGRRGGSHILGDLLGRVMLCFCLARGEGQDFRKDNTPKKPQPTPTKKRTFPNIRICALKRFNHCKSGKSSDNRYTDAPYEVHSALILFYLASPFGRVTTTTCANYCGPESESNVCPTSFPRTCQGSNLTSSLFSVKRLISRKLGFLRLRRLNMEPLEIQSCSKSEGRTPV